MILLILLFQFFQLFLFFFFSGTSEIGGTQIRNEFCPIAGRFHFKYNINDGSEEKTECNSYSSDLNNCPDGSQFHLQFKRCSFEDHGKMDFPIIKNQTRTTDLSEHQKFRG